MKNYEKYDLGKMKFTSLTFVDGTVDSYKVKYDGKIIYRKRHDRESGCYFYHALEDFTNWLNSELDILDAEEKEYLSAVIKPFRDDVSSISKQKVGADEEFIRITFGKYYDWETELQPFEEGKMYTGMEIGKLYTLKELGL